MESTACPGQQGRWWSVTKVLTPVLTRNWGDDRAWTLEAYEAQGGYGALRKALDIAPNDLIEQVKEAGLRGRPIQPGERAWRRHRRKLQ